MNIILVDWLHSTCYLYRNKTSTRVTEMRIDLPSMMFEMPQLETFVQRYKKVKYATIAFNCALKVYWRTMLSEAQNHRCCWCGTNMTFVQNQKNSATIEHVTPKSCGGEDHPDNYAIACSRCNSARGTLSIEEFMVRLTPGYVNSHSEKRKQMLEKIACADELNTKYGLGKTGFKTNIGRVSDKLAALDALTNNKGNIFEPDSRAYRYYERYAKNGYVSRFEHA